MGISFHSENIQFDLKQKLKHKQWIWKCIETYQRTPGELAYVFTSNEQLLLMNREYLNHNYFTDVITFDYTEGNVISGDVFISLDQVKLNAEIYGTDPVEELRRVMIHGILHLMGLMDATDEEKETMRKKENEALHLWMKEV